MASAGMDPDIFTHFPDDDEIVKYYSSHLNRNQIEDLADSSSISIPETNKEDDLHILLEDGVLEDLHLFNAELYGIGKDTIIEGVRSLDEDKLKPLSSKQLDDKYWLITKLYQWGWRDKLEIIKTLRSFKSKRKYKRKAIKGERTHSDLSEETVANVENSIRELIPELNETRRKKIDSKSTEVIDESDLIIRFLVESKASRYEQFKFRNSEQHNMSVDDGTEVENIRYWPLTSEYIYIDYSRKEYDTSVSTHEEELVSAVVNELFENPEWGDDIQFVDPTDFSDKTPNQFVQDRIEEQREVIEENNELVGDDRQEEYEEILDDLGTVEQTAIILENVNVEGDPLHIEFETGQSLSEFLEVHNLDDQIEEFNQKSQQREYTLRLGGREIHVGGTQLTIMGDVSKEEERLLTSLLRKEGATI